MKKNIIIKSVIMLVIIFIILLNFNLKVYASTGALGEPTGGSSSSEIDPTENPKYFKPDNSNATETELKSKAGLILGAINVFGVIVSVITLMIIGMKYMFGSIEEKAEYKKTATMYIIGAVLVFSVTTIPNILYKIGSSIQ